MANTKISYKWTREYDQSMPDNGFGCEVDYIITDGVYNLEDYIMDRIGPFEEDENCEGFYYILDDYGERTNYVFMVISEEETDEDLVW